MGLIGGSTNQELLGAPSLSLDLLSSSVEYLLHLIRHNAAADAPRNPKNPNRLPPT